MDMPTVYSLFRSQVLRIHALEATLRPWLYHYILQHDDFGGAITSMLAAKLCLPVVDEYALCRDLKTVAPLGWRDTLVSDLRAIVERDPCTRELATAFLFHKGFQALQSYRLANAFWHTGRRALASFLQNRAAEVYGVDIHPAASIGEGLFIDHATGVVIGETAVVGTNVSILQGVTLGGTGNESGDRHPKVGDDVLLGAGATLLGNINIGRGARVGASSVVLHDVEPDVTVVGVPARCVRKRDLSPDTRLLLKTPA